MRSVVLAISFFALNSCGYSIPATAGTEPSKDRYREAAPGSVNLERLSHADLEAGQWFTPGRDAGSSYYSPLSKINTGSVARLGFAWQYALGTTRRLRGPGPLVAGNFLMHHGTSPVFVRQPSRNRKFRAS